MGINFVILPYNDFLKGENLGFRDRDFAFDFGDN
jgi:hypothetical protein